MMIVDVITGSRLHFGLICGAVDAGWAFGGVGMMLREPAWRLSMRPVGGEQDRVDAADNTAKRVTAFLKQIRMSLSFPAVEVCVTEEIPFHTGLGGGTQLALALASAAELMSGIRPNSDPFRLSQMTGRAERSAVGTVGFQVGGFLIDHGIPEHVHEARHVARLSMPEAWRMVLVHPKAAQGLCGERELSFFRQQAQMPGTLVHDLSDQIRHTLVPAVRDADFDAFARSLEWYGRKVGKFYAAEQGDVFAHPAIRTLVSGLREKGISGAAQSSWGPGICIPAQSLTHARSIVDQLPETLENTEICFTITEPMNTGASVRSVGPEPARTQWV